MGTSEKIDELEKKLKKVIEGDKIKIEKRRKAGKMNARERIEALLDVDSFIELDAFSRHRSTNFNLEKNRPEGDGVITGHGTIDGRTVYLFSQDFTIFGGSLGEVHANKICKVMDLAAKNGSPIIGLNDSGGARIQEGVTSLAGYADIFYRNVATSGVVPQFSLILGPCAGGAVYSPAITDFTIMTKENSHMFITGPEVIKTVTHEDVSFDELGGSKTHSTLSGVAHLVSESDEEAFDTLRELLSYIPQHNMVGAPNQEYHGDQLSEIKELDEIIPDEANQTYNIKRL